MRRLLLMVTGLVSFAALSACRQSQDETSPVPTAPPGATTPQAVPAAATEPARPSQSPSSRGASSQGSAQLELTGALTKTLEGPIVTCGFTRREGRDQGGTWAIHTDELDFKIMALTDEELAEPAAVLNARQPARASYVFKRKAGKVSAAKDRTVAEIDADLHNVVGKETVHVKGTLTCPPR